VDRGPVDRGPVDRGPVDRGPGDLGRGELGPEIEGLETADWLAVLLGPPTSRWSGHARELVRRRDPLELAAASVAELVEEFALPPARAARVVAAFQLGRRLERFRRAPRRPIRSAEAVFELLHQRLRGLERETFLALILDGKHRLRRLERVSEGTLNSSLVHPREVFRRAVRESAAALIVAHNHPSGDPEPSQEDLDVTRRLGAAGRTLGIPLLDHVIVGESAFVSLRERIEFDAP